MKVSKFRTFDEKRAITPTWVIGFTSKLSDYRLLGASGFIKFSKF
jgi:hypothetical protein